ncbi:MAG TPA: ATP-binding protein [Trebonia sp.]|nr:ATP-binding protein [Trebonia sp.]
MAPPTPSRRDTAVPQQPPAGDGPAAPRPGREAPRPDVPGDPVDCQVPLAADTAAASQARAFLRALIGAWGLPVDVDIVLLLASELVANAVTHTSEGAPADGAGDRAVTMTVRCARGKLRVEVHDGSRSMPVPAPLRADDDAENGRGLMLVDALAAEWGFYRTPGGKVVYFTLPFDAEAW